MNNIKYLFRVVQFPYIYKKNIYMVFIQLILNQISQGIKLNLAREIMLKFNACTKKT